MAIAHRTLRTSFAEAATLVRATTDPPPTRVTFLADHVDFLVAVLHGHHASEDELLWPVLLERAPAEAAMVSRVADQHVGVSLALDEVTTACSAWRRAPDGAARDRLADALDSLSATLGAHLDDEEREVVPLAARTMTQQEWDRIGQHSVSTIPRNKLLIAFGAILEPLDEEDRSYMLGEAPLPVRVLWRIVGVRSYGRYVGTLRGTG